MPADDRDWGMKNHRSKAVLKSKPGFQEKGNKDWCYFLVVNAV